MGRALLFLSGPPGIGKTEVGVRVAQKLAIPHYDLDEEIERNAEMSIAELVEQQGWTAMRRLETETLNRLISLCEPIAERVISDHPTTTDRESSVSPVAVISVGGGSILDDDSRKLMRSTGVLVTLWATLELLQVRQRQRARRYPDRARPIPVTDLDRLIAERCSVYLDCDVWVETLMGESPQQLGRRAIRAFTTWHQCERSAREIPVWLAPPPYLRAQYELQREAPEPEDQVAGTELEARSEDGSIDAVALVAEDRSDEAAAKVKSTQGLELEEYSDRGPTSAALASAQDFDHSAEVESRSDLETRLGDESDPNVDTMHVSEVHETPAAPEVSELLLPDLDLLKSPDFYEEFDDPQLSEYLYDLKPAQAQDLLEIIGQYAEELNTLEADPDATESARSQLYHGEHTLQVTGYQVHFRKNAEAELIDWIIQTTGQTHDLTPSIVIVSDETVARLYSGSFVGSLQRRGLSAHLLTFPVGERSKSLRVLEALSTRLLELGIHRRDWLIALGGGVTGDLCGLLAALYMRGLKWAQIPTTLLAQVDSSVGAKTAVNHPLGKNLLGAFYRPQWVWIDEIYLHTLAPRQLIAGWVEAVKHGLIADRSLFESLSAIGVTFEHQEQDQIHWADLIRRSVQIKAEIVESDEHERGQRMLLNLGHTLGHAFEACHRDLLHGEAVALGICATAEYASRYGALSVQEMLSVKACFDSAGLSSDWRSFMTDHIWRWVARDKKRAHDKLQIITLDAIGSARSEALTLETLRERMIALI